MNSPKPSIDETLLKESSTIILKKEELIHTLQSSLNSIKEKFNE